MVPGSAGAASAAAASAGCEAAAAAASGQGRNCANSGWRRFTDVTTGSCSALSSRSDSSPAPPSPPYACDTPTLSSELCLLCSPCPSRSKPASPRASSLRLAGKTCHDHPSPRCGCPACRSRLDALACSSFENFLWLEARTLSVHSARRAGSTCCAHNAPAGSGSIASFTVRCSAWSSDACRKHQSSAA